ncbi:MAG: hypothetical protein PHS14_08225 [Elusimicrobia bacterium]|nr:hypothetical protein [Elusimicrobiota bacterium]
MKSLIDLGKTHVRHLVADSSGQTLCKLDAARMFFVKPEKESGYILCPKCLKARDAIEAEAKKVSA